MKWILIGFSPWLVSGALVVLLLPVNPFFAFVVSTAAFFALAHIIWGGTAGSGDTDMYAEDGGPFTID